MARNMADEKSVYSDSIENEVEEMAKAEAEAEEDEEEALSLCDLPISDDIQSRKEDAESEQTQEDFDFGSWGDQASKESKMCAADEVFFQGQILPLRHSSISPESSMPMFQNDSRNLSRCVSRSESTDHPCSGGFRSNSSKSSSIRSHNSSSSGSCSSATTNTTTATTPPYKSRLLSQFHSHPSPSPQSGVSSIPNQSNPITQKSAMWSFFQVGLVQAPEIALQDLKIRNSQSDKKDSGSRSLNSTSSSTNSFSFSKDTIERTNVEERKMDQKTKIKKKKQGWFLDINGRFFGGCKCSVNAVETVPIPTRLIVIKNNSSNVNGKERDQSWKKTKQQQQPQGKQAILSRHRTFEWLKELSLLGVPIGE